MQKDILVLTRYIREGAETAHHLISSGFKVVSNESLLLTSSPKVKLLINLLKYISDSRNNLAKTDLLYEYIVYVKNETPEFNPLFTDYRNPEATVFTDIMPAEFFAAGDKTKLNPAFFRLSLYELLEMLIRIFSLNNSADAYLLRFLELVIEYSSQNTNDITGFLEWWSVNCDEYSIVVPEQEDAVRVMTIHKAKGLQSPVVIIPFANWELDISSGDLIWASSGTPPFSESSAYLVRAGKTLKKTYFEKDFDEEAVLTNLDNLNLLYVAFTRAVDRLYIAVPSKPTKTNTGSLVKNVLHHNMELSHALVSENEFKMGVPAENNNKEAAGDASYKAGEMLCTEYYSRTVVRPASAGISIEKAKKYAQLKNRGILLHKALSLIKYPDEAESAYEQLKIQGLITSENEDEFIGELIDILKNEEIKPWFSREYEIKTESELALPDGRVYKPDRVLIKDKKAIVIDYKTGKHKKEHKTQILQYAEILEQMGYNGIEKYLFYVPEREVVKL